MKKSSEKQSRGRQSSKQQNTQGSRGKQGRRKRTTPVAPAVLVGTTDGRKPKLVVKRPVTLAEAIAEPVIDMAKEKPVSVRKIARRTA
jgi:hypothetical protein